MLYFLFERTKKNDTKPMVFGGGVLFPCFFFFFSWFLSTQSQFEYINILATHLNLQSRYIYEAFN